MNRKDFPLYKNLGCVNDSLFNKLLLDLNELKSNSDNNNFNYDNYFSRDEINERIIKIDGAIDLPARYNIYPLTYCKEKIKTDTVIETKSDYKKLKEVHLNRNSNNYRFDLDPRNSKSYVPGLPDSFKNLLDHFNSYGLCRTYLACLYPNTKIFEHIDADVKEYIKIHIPLTTNKDSYFIARDKKQIIKHCAFPGNIIYYNIAYPHYVENSGQTVREQLILTFDNVSVLEKDWTI